KNCACAKVRRAFLFASSSAGTNYTPVDGDVALDGSPISWDTSHTITSGIASTNVAADVTMLVKPKVDPAPAGDVSFTAAEPQNTLMIDGEILAVTLDDPSQGTAGSVQLLYGAQRTTGDTFSVTLTEPVRQPNLSRLTLSLGISNGFQPAGHSSTLDVNARR